MSYCPSTKLFKVNKLKATKHGSWDTFDLGVVLQEGRTAEEVLALLDAKVSNRTRFEVRPVWVGWTVCGNDVDDGWLIRKYGLLKADLSDAA